MIGPTKQVSPSHQKTPVHIFHIEKENTGRYQSKNKRYSNPKQQILKNSRNNIRHKKHLDYHLKTLIKEILFRLNILKFIGHPYWEPILNLYYKYINP